MTRFQLRLKGCDFPLAEGEVLIGRDRAACHLVIEDPCVSRRHAALQVRAHGMTIIDLGSSNGVLVNGIRIDKPVSLDDRDIITVGGHELRVGIITGATRPLRAPISELPPNGARQHGNEDTMAAAIDEALESGRRDVAERMVMARLQSVLSGLQSGTLDARALAAPTRYAMQMALATRQSVWIDWVFQSHHVARAVIPVAVVDQLFVIVRVSRYSASRWASAYLEGLGSRVATLSSMDRIANIRVQGLLRSLHSHSSGPQETCPDPQTRPQSVQAISRSK